MHVTTPPSNAPKGRECVFCGGPAGSREHAPPTWLAEHLQAGKSPVYLRFFSDTHGWEAQGGARGGLWKVIPDPGGENHYEIRWEGGKVVDLFTLSRDGNRLFGKNTRGERIEVRRVEE